MSKYIPIFIDYLFSYLDNDLGDFDGNQQLTTLLSCNFIFTTVNYVSSDCSLDTVIF